MRTGTAIPILLYHGVGPLPDGAPKGLSITASRFREHIEWLARKGYATLSPGDLAAIMRNETLPPRRPIVITFDDGFANLVDHALPILVEHGFKATIFMVTESIGGTAGWDQPPEDQAIPLMSADQIRHWDKLGISFGAHTRTHRYLTRLPESDVIEEIEGSANDLTTLLGQRPEAFAYPYGAFSTAISEEVARHFRVAFTVNERLNYPGSDPYLLGRFPVMFWDTPRDLAVGVRVGFSPRTRLRLWIGRHTKRLLSVR
jgi:peptidoglycan/xylan/chitin deacetylase (PgdA/CDA1 family)